MTRRSLTWQISLLFALISFLVIAAMGFAIDRMLASELLEANDALLLGNMSLLRGRLARMGPSESILASPRFVEEMAMGYRKLGLAVLDEDRRILAASEGFGVPVEGLPERAIPIEALPEHIDNAAERELRARFGGLSRQWIAPDGRWYQVLLARVSLPGEPKSALIALSYDRSLPRELLARYRKGLIETLVVSVLAAAALGVWAARLVLKRARGIAATAGRISANALNERLSLEDTPEEFLETALAFNHMLDRLESSFRRLSEFSSDLAHDLRTPINNLLGEAQVALSRPRDAAEYRAVIESAVEEYERLSRMIENMLFLARADNAQARAAPQWIDLRSALEKILSYYEVLAEECNIRLALDVRGERGGRARAWADELMLNRAVGNLLSNALRHGPRDCTVSVRALARADGSAEVEVVNPGAGIAREHLPRIFDRFYRPSSSREGSSAGSGLGLAIVKSIAELHGGRVGVRSDPGRETAFTLSLPAAGRT
ncbi:MAG TPA: heavy metal sensor histidine kinase [Burkholderiales bacterium]|nr:heavy metal sensor histidine kinase [Burkholderiales bacterium]HUK05372.1 heavy metal sensor histidine kinase [Burkholderiales bacterium]